MKNLSFILKSTFSGMVVYSLAALLVAFIKINYFGSDHPHNMDRILYFLAPIFGGISGAILGLIFSIIHLRDHSFARVKKSLVICLLLSIPIIIVFFINN